MVSRAETAKQRTEDADKIAEAVAVKEKRSLRLKSATSRGLWPRSALSTTLSRKKRHATDLNLRLASIILAVFEIDRMVPIS